MRIIFDIDFLGVWQVDDLNIFCVIFFHIIRNLMQQNRSKQYFFQQIIHHSIITSYLQFQIPHQFIYPYIHIKSNMLQQLKSYTNIAQPLLELPMQVYGKARDTTMQTYEANLVKVKQTQKNLVVFKKEFIQYVKDISWETFNELIHILEVIARVEDRGLDVLEKKKLSERIQLIYQSALKAYVQQPYKIGKEKTIEIYHQGQKLTMKKCLPLYIHLKAALIVSQEMLRSFIQSRVSDLKMTYETSKDSVVMFFSGNFNEEVLKEKLANGVEGFKQLTIKIVSKGLEVKVDKESLVQNYDKFVVDFLRVVHQMKEKSQENIGEVKKKSKDLYQQVVNRIKAKELQIRTQMKSSEEHFLDKQDE